MGYDTGIADRLRAAGLKVIEVDGWRTRGSSTFAPRGYVNHHTAGARSGNAPSLGICINGRSDLPGPLCNVLTARDNSVYVVAAGRANHAGQGGWDGLTGNSSMYGNENENVGTGAEPWRPDQLETQAKVAAALLGPHGNPSYCCEHFEWAPHRKNDAYQQDGNAMRARIKGYMEHGFGGVNLDMAQAITYTGTQAVWISDGTFRVGLGNPDELKAAQAAGLVGDVKWLPQSLVERIPDATALFNLAWQAAQAAAPGGTPTADQLAAAMKVALKSLAT